MRHRSHIVALHFLLVLFITACLLPQPLSPAAPTADSNSIATIIAGTAAAAAAQTQSAGVPAPTAAETPTSTPAPTQAPIISNAGTSLEILADGSTRFTDHRYHLQVVFPTGWIAVRPNEPEYYAAWASEWASDPKFTGHLTVVQNKTPDQLRVYVISVKPEHSAHGERNRISIIFESNAAETLEDFVEDQSGDRPFEGFERISTGYQDWPDGRRGFVFEDSWDAALDTGEIYTIYYKGAIFKVEGGALIFDLLAPQSIKDLILPDYQHTLDGMLQLP